MNSGMSRNKSGRIEISRKELSTRPDPRQMEDQMAQAKSIPTTDPIYAAIEARKHTRALWDEAAHRWSEYEDTHRTPTGGLPMDARSRELEQQRNAAGDTDWHAIEALFRTQPTTIEGMITLLEYIVDAENEIDGILTLRDEADDPGHHVLFSTLIASLHRLAA
jgi:hypothetical protein